MKMWILTLGVIFAVTVGVWVLAMCRTASKDGRPLPEGLPERCIIICPAEVSFPRKRESSPAYGGMKNSMAACACKTAGNSPKKLFPPGERAAFSLSGEREGGFMGAWNNFRGKPDNCPSEDAFWDRTIPEELSRIYGVWPLTGDHWKVIEFVREYYLERGVGPTVFEIRRATGFGPQRLFELFPGGILWGAHFIAGLPHPGKVNSPHPREVGLKGSPDESGEMRIEPRLEEAAQPGSEVSSGIAAEPKRPRQLANNRRVQWAVFPCDGRYLGLCDLEDADPQGEYAYLWAGLHDQN
jgi:tRNA 2-thiouridine synthesizing protein E